MTSTNQITDAEMATRVAARQVRERDAQRRFAAIPAPADATCISPWTEWDHTLWVRCFTGHRTVIDNVTVEVVGSQVFGRHRRAHRARLRRRYGQPERGAAAIKVAAAITAAAQALNGGASAQAAQDTADEAWSAVPVDSTYYPCCRGIGRHTPDREEEPPFM